MKLTKQWLKKEDACSLGVEWFENQKETNGVKVVQKLMGEDKFNWANLKSLQEKIITYGVSLLKRK